MRKEGLFCYWICDFRKVLLSMKWNELEENDFRMDELKRYSLDILRSAQNL